MNVTCLSSQADLYEARILRRMADPVFVSQDALSSSLATPLLLFGEWDPSGAASGWQWLASVAYRLQYPCIVFPPFPLGPIDQAFGLKVGLSIAAISSNSLAMDRAALPWLGDQSTIRVQADFAFPGPAGRSLVTTTAEREPVVVALQPKSTATPLVLCGARLFSLSGLSETADRQLLFNSILAWANSHSGRAVSKPPENEPIDMAPEQLDSIAVLLAGTGAATVSEIMAMADSVLGLQLSQQELAAGLARLASAGLVSIHEGSLSVASTALERFLDERGLWSYVRILRSDFGIGSGK